MKRAAEKNGGKMYNAQEFLPLAERLSEILEWGKVTEIREASMDAYEKGYSGATLVRLECLFETGERRGMICKKTDLKERRVMERLTAQGHAHTPAACSLDCVTDEPRWMIQQDLGKRIPATRDCPGWMRAAAEAFAEIHGNNLGRGDEMPWLPRADAAYWEKIVTQISVTHFEKAVCEDPEFARQFEAVLPKLQAAGKRFAGEMTALCEEAQGMTLTHGDVQDIGGSHVYDVDGRPYLIDFGFSSYAPFYIDLVDYFAPEEARLCQQAMAQRGHYISPAEFEERFRAASPYPGFIYMFPGIMHWKRGSEARLQKCLKKILGD